MTRIDRHHDVARALDVSGRLGHPRHAGGLDRVQIHHQSMPITRVRFQQKGLGPDRLPEVEHHPQSAIRPWGVAQTAKMDVFDRSGGKTVGHRDIGEIDHQAVRPAEREHLVLGRARRIEHQSGVIRGCPQAYASHLRGRELGYEQQQCN